jgi:hypothetical protein
VCDSFIVIRLIVPFILEKICSPTSPISVFCGKSGLMAAILAQLLNKTCVAELNKTEKQDTLVLSTSDVVEDCLTVRFT